MAMNAFTFDLVLQWVIQKSSGSSYQRCSPVPWSAVGEALHPQRHLRAVQFQSGDVVFALDSLSQILSYNNALILSE